MMNHLNPDTEDYYGVCYDICAKQHTGHTWDVCLADDGTCFATTCPTAHSNLQRILTRNVCASDFGDWNVDETTRDEFISLCVDAFGVPDFDD